MESWWNDLLRSSHEVDKNNEDYSDDFRNLLHGKGNFEVPADHYSEMLDHERDDCRYRRRRRRRIGERR